MPNRPAPRPRSLVSRITAILSTFATGDSHTVTEIAHMTGLPVSTTHRLVGELTSWQLLRRTEDGQYEVGFSLHRLSGDVRSLPRLHERATQVVTDLSDVTRRRARLGILRGTRVAYIEKQVGPRPATTWCAGATLPAHATALGKAILAFAPRAAIASVEQELTAHTASTLISPDQLRRALQGVRRTGTAVARGELFPGDRAIAVPVFGSGGVVVAALELAVCDQRSDVEVCTAALSIAARSLSRELAIEAGHADRPPLRLLSGASRPGPGATPPVPLRMTATP